MRKPPKVFVRVKAGHYSVRMVWIDEDEYETHELDGYIKTEKEIGGIYEDLRPAAGGETLVHELLHAVCTLAGITDEAMPKDEETLVDLLAKHICPLIRGNRDLSHWIVDSLHSKEPTIRDAWERRKKKR